MVLEILAPHQSTLHWSQLFFTYSLVDAVIENLKVQVHHCLLGWRLLRAPRQKYVEREMVIQLFSIATHLSSSAFSCDST